MPVLLDLIYIVLLVGCSPYLLYRALRDGKYREGWAEKFLGRAPSRVGDRECVWFHAVSVGEVLVLRSLVREFAARRGDWQIVISTTTKTGLAVARSTFPDLVTFYAPLDFSWAVRRAIARVRPTVLALVELELWPNLIHAAKQSGASVAIINGRLSARSFQGYGRLRCPLGATIRRLDVVAAQSDEYALRFASLGVPRPHIAITGSIKYDGLESDRDNPKTLAFRRELGLAGGEVVFIAGSTMEGEEAAALTAFQAARSRFPGIRFIVAPRHPERFDAVARLLSNRGERVARRSAPVEVTSRGVPPVLLIDTIGELAAVWGLADVAFVGGSLFPGRGGQNMMEPAAYGASVMFGPHISNFKEAVDGLLRCDGARMVANENELTSALIRDLEEPETATERGVRARSFVLAQNGASQRTVQEIERLVNRATV